ncbi:MAG: secretin N-terminal domain-containing protein [Chthoniobacterales bacterium]
MAPHVLRPSFIAASLVATLVSALAQPAQPPNVPAPARGKTAGPSPVAAQPLQPGPQAEPAQPAANPPADNAPGDLITLQYPNSDVQDVLHLYETLTGKRLVMDNNVQGKVNIFISKPIPRDEAVRIIEMNLALNGYSLVPAEEGIMEVLGAGKNPRAASVPIISEVEALPKGDQVVSFVFKLQYADPAELQQLLSQYFQSPGGTTAILALPKSGSIVATQSASVIRRIAEMVEQLDVAPAKVVSEFIALQRADAQKVVDMLREIFEKGNQPGTPSGPGVRPIVRAPNNPGVPPVPGQPGGTVEIDAGTGTMVLSEEALVVGKIKIAADVRTNRIHVITRPMNLPFIRQLISEFDANVEFAKPVTRPLRYISAADVLPVIVQTLTEPGAQGGTSEGTNNPNINAQQQAQQRRTTGYSNTASTNGDFNQNGGTGSASSGLNVSEELSTQAVDTTPKAVTIGNAKIIADQRANAIIVLGNREVVVKVEKLLDEMDVSSPQVALSTVIGELSLNDNEDFGVDYFSRFNQGNPFSGAVGSRNTGNPALSGRPTNGGIFDPAGILGITEIASNLAKGTNVYLAAGNTFAAIVHMLTSTGNFKTISRPTVFTSNNKKAIIASGTEIPVPVSTISSAVGNGGIVNTGLAQQSNIQFKKVALQLEVVPLINSEREVSLDILQKLDSVASFTQVDNNQIPNIATRYIRTTVSAPNCSTIVLGGLITDDKTRDTTGIPVLSRIPVIGGLFRNTSRTKKRTELIVLMRPEVTLTKLELARLRQKNEDKSHFGPEIDKDDCPDCPPTSEKQIQDKEIVLPAPDLPAAKTNR